MNTTTEQAAEAAERFRALKAMIAEGLSDVEAGRVSEWNLEDFLRDARSARPR